MLIVGENDVPIVDKTQFIVKDMHDEYDIKWVKKIFDTKPCLENGKPIFIIIGSKGRIEINTTDMIKLEKYAKLLTQPKGRGRVSADSSRILIKEKDGKETVLGVVFHHRVKHFVPIHKKEKIN